MSGLELLAIAVALYVLGITTGLRWSRRALRRRPDPNPFGELPPVQPQLEQSWHVATVDRKTLRIVSAARVPLHHNANPDARN